MNDKELVTLTETVARSKSNTHAIEELREEIKEIRKENKVIYELSSSIKILVQDVSTMKESINEVKDGQKNLTDKMDKQISSVKERIDKVDEKSKIDTTELHRNSIKQSITPFIIGGGSVGAIIYIVSEIIKALG